MFATYLISSGGVGPRIINLAMKLFVWDQYKDDVRFALTLILVGTAWAGFVNGFSGWSAVASAGAAIAYHAEYKLVIDPKRRRFEWRVLVRPFGKAQVGSLDSIHCIRLSKRQAGRKSECVAEIVFKARKNEDPFVVVVASGSIQQVFASIEDLAMDTGIRIEESPHFRLDRESNGIAALLTTATGQGLPRKN